MKNQFYHIILLVYFSSKCVAFDKSEESRKEFELANKLLSSGHFSDALSHYHKSIEYDSNNYQALYRRSATYQILGHNHLALIDLNDVIELKPDFNGARQQRANILLKKGALNEAENDYQLLKTQISDNSEILEKLEQVENSKRILGEINEAVEENDCEYALKLISQIIDIQNLNPYLYRIRSKCYESLSDLKNAVQNLRQVIKLTSDNTDDMYSASQLFYKLGNIDESLKMIRECLKLNPDHSKCYEFYRKIRKLSKLLEPIQTSYSEENWSKCVESSQKAKKIFENDKNERILSNLYRFTCKCEREAGNVAQAIIECTYLLKLDENDIEILFERGEGYLADDNFEAAIGDFEKILEIVPHHQKASESIEKAKMLKERGSERDYYKILGVKRTANKREITKAYRKLAQKWHPDNFSDEVEKKKAEKKFIDIAAAKEVLTDEEKRRQFDQGHDPLNPKNQNNQGNPFNHGFNPFGGNGGGSHQYYYYHYHS